MQPKQKGGEGGGGGGEPGGVALGVEAKKGRVTVAEGAEGMEGAGMEVEGVGGTEGAMGSGSRALCSCRCNHR